MIFYSYEVILLQIYEIKRKQKGDRLGFSLIQIKLCALHTLAIPGYDSEIFSVRHLPVTYFISFVKKKKKKKYIGNSVLYQNLNFYIILPILANNCVLIPLRHHFFATCAQFFFILYKSVEL